MKLLFRLIIIAAAVAAASLSAWALEPEAYASQSVLSSGKWVKISVEQSGMHYISNRQLSDWGFKIPSRVRIHGYGGAMLSDVLDPDLYLDDLPQVATSATPTGLVFYAVGPSQISMANNGSMSHAVNPYDTKGYYYLTEADSDSALKPSSTGSPLADLSQAKSTAIAMLVHEQELTSPGGSGRLMVGEDFNYTRSRSFPFTLTERVEQTDVTVNCSFFAHTVTSTSSIALWANGEALPESTTDRIPVTTSGSDYWGKTTLSTKTFQPSGSSLNLQIQYQPKGMVNKAALDYLEVIYTRRLTGAQADFFSTSQQLVYQGADGVNLRIWDVTDPYRPEEVNMGSNGGWRADRPGARHYAAWSVNSASTLPAPKRVGAVSNQNLHGIAEVPDMVIIAPQAYLSAARTIADIHHTNPLDPIKVEVVELKQIQNEFGSGCFDPGAIRRFLKMLYDRGQAAGTPLRYALLIGKGTQDNRRLTGMSSAISNHMPLWVSEASLQNNQSFSTDDYFALLDDYDGLKPGQDKLDIAVGRIPCTNLAEANVAADKIKRYIYSMPRDDWRTRFTLLVDDENEGVHMVQTEKLLENLTATPQGQRYVLQKVYCDAYERANSTYPQARQELYDYLADGTGVFAFIGHGSPNALGSKNIITATDFRDRFHLRRLPFFYAATCSFLQWDQDIISQAESLFFQEDGGMIGCISALRPVFITNNGNLSASFGTAMSGLDSDGRELTMGELYRRAKNGVDNDVNKMRYVLMADPALRLGSPGWNVKVETINGLDATNPADNIDIKARQELVITGSITDSEGRTIDDFNGQVSATLYDAEHSTTSRGWGEGGHITFEQMGSKLLSATAKVENGVFTLRTRMPSVIANNYRPATLSLYASATEKSDLRHAMGVVRNVYATGYDATAPDDDEPPLIHALGLNGFESSNASTVNESPLVMARISDDTGINMSSAGIGRLMTITIDGTEHYHDGLRYFTVDAEPMAGAMSGTLAYQLNDLADGPHTLRLRVWDINDNCAEATFDFNVKHGLKPEIFKVYTDANPAKTEANFYVSHNRPEALMRVRITVFNLMGQPLWSKTVDSRSNLGTTEPILWDLTDTAGRRLGKGIYIYRAEISTDGQTYVTKSRKIAIAGS